MLLLWSLNEPLEEGDGGLVLASFPFTVNDLAQGNAAKAPQMFVESSVGRLIPIGSEPAVPAVQAWSATWVGQAASPNQIINLSGSQMASIHINESQDVTIWARVTNSEGGLITSADVQSAQLNVFDTTSLTPSTPVLQEALVVEEVMYSTLQVDKGWRRDKEGYTLKLTVDGATFVEGGRLYRVEIILRTVRNGPVPIVVPVHTHALRTPRGELGA